MSVKTYSVKKYGKDYAISEHFKLREMQCKNGADTVLVSSELMTMLEKLRAYVGGSITIVSGYRTAAYNRSIGGASASQHVKGTAADIITKDSKGQVVDARLICCLCQTLGLKGVARISSRSVHVDMRASGSYRGDEYKGYGNNVGGDFYRYFGLSKAAVAALKYVAPATKSQEEETMTQEQFNAMMDNYLAERAKKAPDAWSKTDREWAEANGIIKGTGDKMEYKSFCTREQMVAFLHRLISLT